MHKMDLRGIDLNLLLVFRSLMETGNTTRTAERLGLSQPAVSRALGKLRAVFNDPLMLKGAKGMLLTERADQLKAPLIDLLDQLKNFFDQTKFDPLSSDRVFRLTTTDYGAIILLTKLMPLLAAQAPSVALEILPFSSEMIRQLGEGHTDFALYSDEPVPSALRTRALFIETYSCLIRKGHPLLASDEHPLSLDNFLRWPHALVSIRGGRVGAVDEALASIGLARKISLWIPYFATAAAIVAESDLLLTLPTRAAAQLASLAPLTLLPVPIEVERFGYRLLWHDRSQQDEGATWMRGLIYEALSTPG